MNILKHPKGRFATWWKTLVGVPASLLKAANFESKSRFLAAFLIRSRNRRHEKVGWKCKLCLIVNRNKEKSILVLTCTLWLFRIKYYFVLINECYFLWNVIYSELQWTVINNFNRWVGCSTYIERYEKFNESKSMTSMQGNIWRRRRV